MADNFKSFIAFIPGVAVALGNVGLQVSGYQSFGLAVTLWCLSGGLLLLAGFHVVWTWQKRRRENGLSGIEPIYLVAVGLIIAIVGLSWMFLQQPRHAVGGPLQSKIDDLQKSFDKYVKPRSLSQEQSNAIRDFLLPRDKFKIAVYFYFPDRETEEYSAQLAQAFQQGGWDVERQAIVNGVFPGGAPAQQGLQTRMIYGPDFKGGSSKSMITLDGALNAGKVRPDGRMGSHGVEAQGSDVALQLLVGKRPSVIEDAR